MAGSAAIDPDRALGTKEVSAKAAQSGAGVILPLSAHWRGCGTVFPVWAAREKAGEDRGLQRHWSINGRFLTQPLTGVQRYATEVVSALDMLLTRGHPLTDELSIDLVVPPGPCRALQLATIAKTQRGTVGGHLWEQAVLPRALAGGLLSLGNTGPVSVRRQILCVHDVNTRVFPKSYSPAFRVLQRVLVPALGRTAAALATVSHHAAGEIVRHGICDRRRLAVMPNGHEHVLRWQPLHSEATRRVAGPTTIVMIGTPAPHKNIGLILGMADRLAALGLRVAIVGSADRTVYQARGIDTGGDAVTWLGKVSDPALAALLGSCLCLAFPSFVEGFGLPPLEAMALGCPVVSSDRASMPEICGDAALYAAPTDAEAWFVCFARLMTEPGLRKRMIASGRLRADLYSWTVTAECYLSAMSAVDAAWAARRTSPARQRSAIAVEGKNSRRAEAGQREHARDA